MMIGGRSDKMLFAEIPSKFAMVHNAVVSSKIFMMPVFAGGSSVGCPVSLCKKFDVSCFEIVVELMLDDNCDAFILVGVIKFCFLMKFSFAELIEVIKFSFSVLNFFFVIELSDPLLIKTSWITLVAWFELIKF